MIIKSYETIPLETKRLILKKGTIEDYKKVFEFDYRFLRNLGGIFEYKKLPDNYIKEWYPNGIEQAQLENEEKHRLQYIIYLKDGTPIGQIDADNENEYMDNSIELSYNLHPNYWGNGYMPEACEVLINHLFNLGYENIILGYETTETDENINSKRVIEKLGFEYLKMEDPFIHKALGIEIRTVKTFVNKAMLKSQFKNKSI